MFCYQCEQTAENYGCTVKGICGKDDETSTIQDLIIEEIKQLSKITNKLRKLGINDLETDRYVLSAIFSTLTNVNFDPYSLEDILYKIIEKTNKAKNDYIEACKKKNITPEDVKLNTCEIKDKSREKLLEYGKVFLLTKKFDQLGKTITGLQELITYGVKGLSAYADHAYKLGYEDKEVYDFIYDCFDFLTKENPTVDELLQYALKCGEVNYKVMEILDKANTATYGHPEPTKVRITPIKGKAILVSGHDLKDLEELLKQTEGLGVNVYTHGEMLPALAYPGLKKYKHLVGNYGGAWQDQQREFLEFPGSILMTSNCLKNPAGYEKRIFTSNAVGWTGIDHIKNRNFKPVIDAALKEKGFENTTEPERYITIGFARNSILNAADKVIDEIKQSHIKHIYLIGGCDGAESGRNYYTDFADKAPKDSLILTLGCGKFRFNKHEFGDINGIPRLLDIGQCNDTYSAIQVAVALSKAFNVSVNELPLSLIISWFEQKAVAVLLTLLHLGIKNIRLGPNLPAFVTPDVLNVLVEKFDLKPITTADQDIRATLVSN